MGGCLDLLLVSKAGVRVLPRPQQNTKRNYTWLMFSLLRISVATCAVGIKVDTENGTSKCIVQLSFAELDPLVLVAGPCGAGNLRTVENVGIRFE